MSPPYMLPTSSDDSIFATMSKRYLSIPQVFSFLFDSRPPSPLSPSLIPRSFSYACLYQQKSPPPSPISQIPRRRKTSASLASTARMSHPVLEEGNLMLVHGVHDGIAVGFLFSRNNLSSEYSLARTRDSIGITGLSHSVRSRRFATDLRRNHGKEYVEFGWMDDGSLIIACRRLEPGAGLGGCVLTAELLFYDKPEFGLDWNSVFGGGLKVGRLIRMMCATERTEYSCIFCSARGLKICACPPALKQRRKVESNAGVVDSDFLGYVGGLGETGDRILPAHLDHESRMSPPQVATWSNFVQRVFGMRRASGSFSVRWWKARDAPNQGFGAQGVSGANDLEFFIELRRTVPYDFVCGSEHDTNVLISLYLAQQERRSRMCRNEARLLTDTTMENDYHELQPEMFVVEHNIGEEVEDTDDIYDTSLSPPCYIDELDNSSPITSTRSSPAPDGVPVYHKFRRPVQEDGTDPVAEIVRDCGLETIHDAKTDFGEGSSLSSEELSKLVAVCPGSSHDTYQGTELSNDFTSGTYEDSGPNSQKPRTYVIPTSPEGRPMCPMCGRQFPKPGNVKRHIETVHENQRPYRCEECGKRFGHKTHRDRHRKSHTPVLPYGCQWCKARFRTPDRLDRHVGSVHKTSNGSAPRQSSHMCQHCGVAFAQKSNLNRHIATIHEHRRYRCSFCSQTFGQQFDMKRHVLRQHKEIVS